VLTRVHDHAAQLGIDPTRIAVLGASAGGGLSAATCLMSRDRGGPTIALQCLLIPMLDDRGNSGSMQAVTDARVVNGREIRQAWDLLSPPRARRRDNVTLRRPRPRPRPR
jgi:acetyl esterase